MSGSTSNSRPHWLTGGTEPAAQQLMYRPCPCIHRPLYVHTHAYIHTYIHVHTHTHTYLHFNATLDFGGTSTDGRGPLRSPSPIPEVVWVVLVVFDAGSQFDSTPHCTAVHSHHSIGVMVLGITGEGSLQRSPVRLGSLINGGRSHITRLLLQVIVFEGTFCTRIQEPSSVDKAMSTNDNLIFSISNDCWNELFHVVFGKSLRRAVLQQLVVGDECADITENFIKLPWWSIVYEAWGYLDLFAVWNCAGHGYLPSSGHKKLDVPTLRTALLKEAESCLVHAESTVLYWK